jgi:hypothetical protein
MNRIFQDRQIEHLHLSFRNVTDTARDWEFPFPVHVQTELLRDYVLPGSTDSEGSELVGALVHDILEALAGTFPATAISCGRLLRLEFTSLLQQRRKAKPEPVPLFIVIGPCDGLQIVYAGLLLLQEERKS